MADSFSLAKSFIVIMISIVAIAIIGITIAYNLNTSGVASSSESGNEINITTDTSCNYTGCYTADLRKYSTEPYEQCTLTATLIRNSTDGVAIGSTNYSVSGCKVSASSTVMAGFNNTPWKITGTYTYKNNRAYDVSGNYTTGLTNFFKNVPTLFTILFVVVLVALLGIVIYYISSGFGGRQVI